MQINMTSIQACSPIDERPLKTYAVQDGDHIREQMEAARRAGIPWAERDVALRGKIVGALSRILLDNLDRLADAIVVTTGKVRTEALVGEIYPVLDLLSFYQKNAARILASRPVSTSPWAYPHANARVDRRPYGVVAVISPWNCPFQLTLSPLITALIAGNAVVYKTSELSLPIGEVITEILRDIDLPQGLVQWVIWGPEAGEQLIDAEPDLVFFSGGLVNGRAIMARAARHPVPVILELGGKDPMIVCDDAPIQRTVRAAVYGAFCNSGQVCVSVERLYVHEARYEEFVRAVVDAVSQLKIGHGPEGDLGAMTWDHQFSVVDAHYQDALSRGACASGPLRRRGRYLEPVVLWDVSHDMRVMREETFGPLLPIMRFSTEDEVIALANDSEYGLNASVWTSDLRRGERVARRLQVGNWAVNDVIKNIGHPGLPFGGVKKSGFGRYHGAEGLLNFTYPVAGLVNSGRLDEEPNWFPYSERRYGQLKGFIEVVFGHGSVPMRIARNWRALRAFRRYASLNLGQRWRNLESSLSWRREL